MGKVLGESKSRSGGKKSRGSSLMLGNEKGVSEIKKGFWGFRAL